MEIFYVHLTEGYMGIYGEILGAFQLRSAHFPVCKFLNNVTVKHTYRQKVKY